VIRERLGEPWRALRAAAGHAQDLYRLARFDVFNPYGYSKFRTLRAVQRRTGARQLIETGTYQAVTTRRCAAHFEHVYTIELDHRLATQAAAVLRNYPNVTAIEGDAEAEIRRLFSTEALQDVLVFLDGHFSGPGTSMGSVPEPAVDLLEFLAGHAQRIRGIVVDDFREFGSEPGWPQKWQLVRAAEELFVPHGFKLAVQLDQLLLERRGS
jgi:hypothetical protein